MSDMKRGHKKENSIFSMQHVNSHNSVLDWRSGGALSEGASEALVNRLRSSNPCKTPRMESLEERSYVCSLVEDLMWAVRELNGPCDLTEAEGWAVFLHGILTHETRAYHGIAHVFKISAGASPVQLLAAFFRDIISHYIDGLVLDSKQQELLEGVFEPGTLVLSRDLRDPRDLAIAEVFGYRLGENLSRFKEAHEGLDIFLSSLLASRLLGEALALKHVMQVAVCLEATIPFRKPDPSTGKTSLDVLFNRLAGCNDKFGLGMPEDELVVCIQQAADLLNRSVGNMASTDLAEFLDHTWRLLPEKHSPLRQHALYTLTDYYKAIKSMEEMTSRLEPQNVFVSFRDLPNAKESQRFKDRLTQNLTIAHDYLRARSLCVAFVSAMACLTGGDDAPKSFFFGDLPRFNQKSTRLGDNLAVADVKKEEDQVYHLLVTGEGMSETSFDTRHAPLAAFLHRKLGPEGVADALEQCDVPMTTEQAWSLLRTHLPRDVVIQAGNEVGRVAVSRQRWIDRVLSEL